MSETEFARAERLSRELYFANEKLKTYDRMAASGVWVETERYSKMIERIETMREALKFYADGHHFTFGGHSDNSPETPSGEHESWKCGGDDGHEYTYEDGLQAREFGDEVKAYSKDQFEEARLDAYEVTIPRLLNKIKLMESDLLEVRQELNVCMIQMMTGASPDFETLTSVMNRLIKLTPRE